MASREYVTLLTERYPQLQPIGDQIEAAYKILETCYEQGGKLLIAGNGGSCADAEHIVGELMKGFVKRRRVSKEEQALLEQAGKEISQDSKIEENLGTELAECLQEGLPAIALTGHTGLSTAFLNDVNGEMIYAQQLWGYARPEDVFLGISTSGNSKNILYALAAARAKGLKTVVLTGRDGGKLAKSADAAIIVPEQETYKIQELHLPIYHALCLMLEDHFFEL